MKTLLVTLICMASCMPLIAQNKALTGVWAITDLSYVSEQGVQKMMEAEIKSGTAITDFYIMEEGLFRQTSNMSGSGTMDTYEGNWKTVNGKLIINLMINGQKSPDLEYLYKLEDSVLTLERSNPQGTLKIVMLFKKK